MRIECFRSIHFVSRLKSMGKFASWVKSKIHDDIRISSFHHTLLFVLFWELFNTCGIILAPDLVSSHTSEQNKYSFVCATAIFSVLREEFCYRNITNISNSELIWPIVSFDFRARAGQLLWWWTLKYAVENIVHSLNFFFTCMLEVGLLIDSSSFRQSLIATLCRWRFYFF